MEEELPVGAAVELRGLDDEGFPFSWFEASLAKPLRLCTSYPTVTLTHFTNAGGAPALEVVARQRLRPPAPGCSRAEALMRLSSVYPPGSAVDVRHDDVWWEATVLDERPGGLRERAPDGILVEFTGAQQQ